MSGKIRFRELPNWKFTVDERSVGVFEVTAAHHSGRSIVLTGVDPDATLGRLRAEAGALASSEEQSNSSDY